jgi:FkbM family methyltransferase
MRELLRRTVTRAGRTYQVMDHGPDSGGWDFWSVFSDHWEPGIEDVLARYLGKDTAFLDVGAWVGPVSLIAARMCGHVHAVEPDPVARRVLEATVARQRRKNITVHPVAVAAVDGTVRIGRRPDREFGDSMTSTIFTEDAVEVTAVTVQALTAGIEQRIGLVKMDVEGGEEAILPVAAPHLLDLGVPLLLSTHAMLVDDPDRYQAAIASALDGWDVTVLSGALHGLATVLAVPK